MFYELGCRIFQAVLYVVTPFIGWRKPQLIEGEDSVLKLVPLLKEAGYRTVLLITDPGIRKIGLTKPLEKALAEADINCQVFAEVEADPSNLVVASAYKLYREVKAEALIAFGGGSSLDCAKGVGAKLARPNKSLKQMGGLLKIRRKLPPLYAIPTTAGTGSEATLAAVITDAQTHIKYQIDDPVLIPRVAVLDPKLTVGLPPQITAATGLDALTHAVEAYIGHANTKETKAAAREAVTLIFDNILSAYHNGKDLVAREKMLKASYLAGIAFTRAYVGYIHALAHALGAKYHLAHGLANSIVMPYVLRYYGEVAHQRLAELADLIQLTDDNDPVSVKAEKFIAAICALQAKMAIPQHFPTIKDEDIAGLAKNALKEANPLYPVPRILRAADLDQILKEIKGEEIHEQNC